MRKFLSIILLFCSAVALTQPKVFSRVWGSPTGSTYFITSLAQDQMGYIWFGTAQSGLHRFDGTQVTSVIGDGKTQNAMSNSWVESLFIDPDNIIWAGTYGSGLDRFDPVSNTFTHFRHNNADPGSLSNDTVTAVLRDRSGNLWVGTYGGLNLLNPATGKFTRYSHQPSNPKSISSNRVRVVYEDRAGTLWVGCGSAWTNENEPPEEGGLNRFDRTTGQFINYKHNPADPSSLANNKVRSLLEDSRGNFWVGTAGDGLHIMDRKKGTFAHFYYDSTHPEKLSRPPVYQKPSSDHITFIKEDGKGTIWIGTLVQGINQYDPATGKLTHHGSFVQNNNVRSFQDTASGFSSLTTTYALVTKAGLLWTCNTFGSLFAVNPSRTVIPHFLTSKYNTTSTLSANSFYKENKDVLWIATDTGLLRKDLNAGAEKRFIHRAGEPDALNRNIMATMRRDKQGNFWLGTNAGLEMFNPVTSQFTGYRHDTKNPHSLSDDVIYGLCLDADQNLWVATVSGGLDMLDRTTGQFVHHKHNDSDSNSLSSNHTVCVAEGPDRTLWVGTDKGVNKLDRKTGRFQHYLETTIIKAVFVDAAGDVWAGSAEGLFRYNKRQNAFEVFEDPDTKFKVNLVLHILEDNDKNLWISTTDNIARIDAGRKRVNVFGAAYGVQHSYFAFGDNAKTSEGEIIIGDERGYYAFLPSQVKAQSTPAQVNLTDLWLSDKKITPGPEAILKAPLFLTTELTLPSKQNSFAIEFSTVNLNSPGNVKILYRLENYDNIWQEAGEQRKVYFFSVPPGRYVFHVRAVNEDGVWSEKTIRVRILPPWWQRWWVVLLFALALAGFIWSLVRYRSRKLKAENQLLENKVAQRTTELQKSLQDLRATQQQLVQQEKMASLGELTAGIAHEIQNPLNFVNNFSEANNELLEEMKQALDAGNIFEARQLAQDISSNEDKINHHGRRADSIVKSMLQHARGSAGKREPADINALADEYLRLSYHNARAKDKTFNASIQTHFDEGITGVNIVSQDIGRVLLNLFSNAFYAVQQKKALLNGTFVPTVSVTTQRQESCVRISVKDNGNGIQQSMMKKIFQPFFTTKPTGEGTGLGLSLSYDIVTKGHGGTLSVQSTEGEGSEFVVTLPAG